MEQTGEAIESFEPANHRVKWADATAGSAMRKMSLEDSYSGIFLRILVNNVFLIYTAESVKIF